MDFIFSTYTCLVSVWTAILKLDGNLKMSTILGFFYTVVSLEYPYINSSLIFGF